MTRPLLSVISPVYHAAEIIPELIIQLKKALTEITSEFEIILVEDCGRDASWDAILVETANDIRVKGIKLSRNFGQHYAITAGLDKSNGEWVIVMDCDLQDKPSEIKKLYQKAQEGYDIVLARREIRNDKYHKKFFSKYFSKVLSYLTGTKQDAAIANFGIYNKKVIAAIGTMKEPIRFFPTMVNWVGFERTTINVSHGVREKGNSSYNYTRLFRLALDIILANSDKPIRLTIKFGFFIALVSFAFGLFTLIRYWLGNILVAGYTSLLISIWFLSGLTFIVLGVLGLYIGKIFEGVKNRPIYIINKMVNIES